MIIREYKPEDREAIEKCIFELQELELDLEPKLRLNSEKITSDYFDYLVAYLARKNGQIYVAEERGQVLGMVAIAIEEETAPYVKIKKWGFITDISVLKDFRNQGIGKLLMERAEQFTKDNGIRHISLHVLMKNNVASEFYVGNGFREYSKEFVKELNE